MIFGLSLASSSSELMNARMTSLESSPSPGSFAASMNIFQLSLLYHSCCSSNATPACGGLSTCLVLEDVAF